MADWLTDEEMSRVKRQPKTFDYWYLTAVGRKEIMGLWYRSVEFAVLVLLAVLCVWITGGLQK